MDDVYDFLVQCDWLVPLCGPRTDCALLTAWNLRKRCRYYSLLIKCASEFPAMLLELHDTISNEFGQQETICWSVACHECVGGIFLACISVAYEPPKGHLSGFLG